MSQSRGPRGAALPLLPIRTPSATYSPDLDWWINDSGAAHGECSALGMELERMALYGRPEWKPERTPKRRDRVLPGETDCIDPSDYFVDGGAIAPIPRARAVDLQPARLAPTYTAVPRSLGVSSPAIFEPDRRDVERATRIRRAWLRLTVEQQAWLSLAYLYGVHEVTQTEHHAYRRAVVGSSNDAHSDAQTTLKALGGYFVGARHAA